MMPHYSQPDNLKFSHREEFGSRLELQEQIKETMSELHDLLEEYGPAWYPQRLQEKVESTLRLLEK